MKTHRVWTLAGAGSAVAATIILATVVIGLGSHSVQASTIFQSLRRSFDDAFRLTFTDIGAEGVHVSGSLVARYDRTEEDLGAAMSEAEVVFVEAHATGGPEADELAGLDIQVASCLVANQEWVYVRTSGIPAEILQVDPMVGMIHNMTGNGLMMDISGLINKGIAPPTASGDAEGEPITLALEFGADKAEAKPDPEGASATFTLGLGASATDAADGESVGGVQGKAQMHLTTADGQDGMNEWLTSLMTGRISMDQIDDLVALVESSAHDVSIDEQPDGTFVLTASDFAFEDMPGFSVDDELIEEVSLQIAYREDAGVLWATISNIGDYNGTIRLDLVDVTIDESALDRERWIEPGVTTVMDANQLTMMAQTFGLMNIAAQATSDK